MGEEEVEKGGGGRGRHFWRPPGIRLRPSVLVRTFTTNGAPNDPPKKKNTQKKRKLTKRHTTITITRGRRGKRRGSSTTHSRKTRARRFAFGPGTTVPGRWPFQDRSASWWCRWCISGTRPYSVVVDIVDVRLREDFSFRRLHLPTEFYRVLPSFNRVGP